MTFPAVSGATAQAQIQEARARSPVAALPQGSLEDKALITPNGRLDGAPLILHDAPAAKPWAHFIAGG